jgi:hypothetical protein
MDRESLRVEDSLVTVKSVMVHVVIPSSRAGKKVGAPKVVEKIVAATKKVVSFMMKGFQTVWVSKVRNGEWYWGLRVFC